MFWMSSHILARALPLQLYSVLNFNLLIIYSEHDNVIKWKHFLCYWPFLWGIHWSPVNFPHKGQWRGALMCSLICAWTNGWVNNRGADDSGRRRAHYDVIVMSGSWEFIVYTFNKKVAMILTERMVVVRYKCLETYTIAILSDWRFKRKFRSSCSDES